MSENCCFWLFLAVTVAACCLWLPAEAAAPKPYMYVGCFGDASHRDLSSVANVNKMTIEKCYLKCNSLGYRYFGLQSGHQCHCGNRYGTYGEKNERECNTKCAGNNEEYCGGPWRNGIYEIENSPCPLQKEGGTRYLYIGCYGDTGHRDLPTLGGNSYMTVRKCYDLCGKMRYRYFGLQAGTHCFCGNKFGLYGRKHERECDKRCHSDTNEYCGGAGRNAIYEIPPPPCKKQQ